MTTKCAYCIKEESLGYCEKHPVCVTCCIKHHQTDKTKTYYWRCDHCENAYCSSCTLPIKITEKFDYCGRIKECSEFVENLNFDSK